MRPVLYLLPDVGDHGHSRQASLLAENLPAGHFDLRAITVSLGGSGPFNATLQRAGISVSSCRRGERALGWEAWLALRQMLAGLRPGLIHVWGIKPLQTLWAATLLKRSLLPPLVVSLNASVLRRHRFTWWQRRLLLRAKAIVAMSDADRLAMIAAGLPAAKVHFIRPGVPMPAAPPDVTAFRQANQIPANAPLLMGVGHLERSDRFHDAVWAYEFMKYVVPDLQLALVGDGLNRYRLGSHFRTAREGGKGVHFLGPRPDAASLVALADVVLVPHRRSGGTFSTLEAMAAGRPVAATRLPHLAEIIRDGETGVLVPPVDQPALARAVLRLLEDRSRREQIGAAARAAVEQNFRVDAMVERFAELYEGTTHYYSRGDQ